MVQYVNLRRNRGPIFKKGDKVYLLRKNIKMIRLSNRLDYIKLRSFRIKKILALVNCELDLLIKMRIYLSFYILVLKLVNSETFV